MGDDKQKLLGIGCEPFHTTVLYIFSMIISTLWTACVTRPSHSGSMPCANQHNYDWVKYRRLLKMVICTAPSVLLGCTAHSQRLTHGAVVASSSIDTHSGSGTRETSWLNTHARGHGEINAFIDGWRMGFISFGQWTDQLHTTEVKEKNNLAHSSCNASFIHCISFQLTPECLFLSLNNSIIYNIDFYLTYSL